MYELIKVTEKCYYIQCPAKIGLIRLNDNDVCLIDSGNDKESGKKVLRILEQNNWTLKAIYNTHSNSDHIGGNKFLQDRTDCKIYAPGIECDMTNHPILEPAFLYGGYPIDELRHKFLLAQESKAEPLTEENLPYGMEIIHLPGHFFDMVGFKYDDVVYLADALSSKETLDKYRIGFIYDVRAYLETLSSVMGMSAKTFVPAHAGVSEDIKELCHYNIAKVMEIADDIVEICDSPKNFEIILKEIFENYGLTMTYEQNVLIGSTVKSYLAYLKSEGRLKAYIDDNMLKWEKAE